LDVEAAQGKLMCEEFPSAVASNNQYGCTLRQGLPQRQPQNGFAVVAVVGETDRGAAVRLQCARAAAADGYLRRAAV